MSTIADGLAAPSAGELCFDLIKKRFEGVHLANDEQIIEAVKILMSRLKIMPEPAACAGLAAALAQPQIAKGEGPLVLVISGKSGLESFKKTGSKPYSSELYLSRCRVISIFDAFTQGIRQSDPFSSNNCYDADEALYRLAAHENSNPDKVIASVKSLTCFFSIRP